MEEVYGMGSGINGILSGYERKMGVAAQSQIEQVKKKRGLCLSHHQRMSIVVAHTVEVLIQRVNAWVQREKDDAVL